MLILPILASAIWSVVNILDEYLVTKVSRENPVSVLMLYSSLIGLPVCTFLGIYILINPMLNLQTGSLLSNISVMFAGVIYIAGIYFYLKSLEISESSLVIPQLLMIPVFSSILGFFFLGENFTLGGLVGMALISWGSILISISRVGKNSYSFDKRLLFYSLMASMLMSLNSFIFKLSVVDTSIPFTVSFFYQSFGFIIIGLILCMYSNNLYLFLESLKFSGARIVSLNITSEVLTIVGNWFFYMSTIFLPLAYAHISSDGVQPLFVLLFSYILAKLGVSSVGYTGKKSLKELLASIFLIFLGLACIYI